MLGEISIGVQFICSLIKGKIADFDFDLAGFDQRLSLALMNKYVGHWNPNKPDVGSAYRCIWSTTDKMDPILSLAADSAKILISKILPPSLCIWIDPYEVSYRIGVQGSICHLTDRFSQQSKELTQMMTPSLSATSKPFLPFQPAPPTLQANFYPEYEYMPSQPLMMFNMHPAAQHILNGIPGQGISPPHGIPGFSSHYYQNM